MVCSSKNTPTILVQIVGSRNLYSNLPAIFSIDQKVSRKYLNIPNSIVI